MRRGAIACHVGSRLWLPFPCSNVVAERRVAAPLGSCGTQDAQHRLAIRTGLQREEHAVARRHTRLVSFMAWLSMITSECGELVTKTRPISLATATPRATGMPVRRASTLPSLGRRNEHEREPRARRV